MAKRSLTVKKVASKASQRGVALVVVLLIMAVMVALAATMSERLFVHFQRAENQRDHQQAYWYAISIESLAKVAIRESKEEGDTINTSQPWAIEEQVYPLEYGQASGKVRDMQSCFNLNVLSGNLSESSTGSRHFLVSTLQLTLEELGVENYQAEVIADSAREFLDSDDSTGSDFGVEESFYEALQPAYLTANGLLADGSEFRTVQQVNADVMKLAGPVVCAIPTDDWRLNVNTLDEQGAAILTALFSQQLGLSDARELVENRPFDGWESVNDFLAEPSVAAIDSSVRDKAKGYLTVESDYFELDAQILVNESRVRVRSLLYSSDGENVTVIRRRFGGISE